MYNKRIRLLEKAEKNAIKGINYFDKNDEIESEFYNKLQAGYLARKEFDVNKESLEKLGYTEKEIDEYVKNQGNKAKEHYFKSICEFTNEKKDYEMEVSKLESQKKALEKSREQYVVVAQQNGVVHLYNSLTTGEVVQSGSLIGTISNSEELIIETMICSNDRPRVNKKSEVSLAIKGLNQSEYGTIPGKIISIDEDATIDEKNGDAYFKIRIKPKKTYLEDSNGERINLSFGMETETRVKYEKVTYIKYFLDLVGFKLR
jgi:multidrug resistance efflux pump